MSEAAYQDLANLVKQNKTRIETRRFENKPVLKSLWLKFACAYTRFRTVRGYDFFKEAYSSKIIRLRLPDGGMIAYPAPWETALERVTALTVSR